MRLENKNAFRWISKPIKKREDSFVYTSFLFFCPLSPQIHLLKHGEIADRYINQLNDFYDNISVDKYAIMPDHIHLLITISNGQSRTPVPTNEILNIDNRNSDIAKFVSTFKRFCNKEYETNIWQPRYYDHIIRNQDDYNEIWEYIENNPKKWVLTQK